LAQRVQHRFVRCPIDNRFFDKQKELYPDNAVQREIMALTVVCVHQRLGCTWTGELRDFLETHREKTCPFDKVACPLPCGEEVFRSSLQDHLDNMCSERKMCCSQCNVEMPAKDSAIHLLLECPAFPLTCSWCGKDGIPRHDYSTHLDPSNTTESGCPVPFDSCPYQPLGCTHKDIRENIDCHLTEYAQEHLNMALKHEKSHQTALDELAGQVQQMQCHTTEVLSTLSKQGQVNHQLSGRVDALTAVIHEMQEQNSSGQLTWYVPVGSQGQERETVHGIPG
jgi:hypothetical protein